MIVFLACNQNEQKKGSEEINNKIDSLIAKDTVQPAAIMIYTRYVPAQLLSHLSATMPEWRLPDPSSWEKYWWDQHKTDSTLVNYIAGDFDCNGKRDHAMILTDAKNNIGAWAFLSKGNSFENFKLDEFENPGGQIGCGLMLLPPGQHGDLNQEDVKYRVNVKCQGITVIFFEKAARSYYFENGKLKWIQSGD